MPIARFKHAASAYEILASATEEFNELARVLGALDLALSTYAGLVSPH